MEKKSRWVFILTFIFSTAAVAFLSASMGTEYWIESSPTRLVDNNTEDGAKNVTGGDPGSKFKGHIHFGLFHGYKRMDYGLGIREGEIWIKCEVGTNQCSWEFSRSSLSTDRYSNPHRGTRQITRDTTDSVSEEVTENGLFNFGVWVSTIVFVSLGIALGLTSMAFSALNASTKPIETITGPMGLYVWNGIAIFFTIVALILYLVLFFGDMKENILPEEDVKQRWTSKDQTKLHYSFYFLLIAVVLYAANILTVALSGIRIRPIRYGHNMNAKAMDGVMMY